MSTFSILSCVIWVFNFSHQKCIWHAPSKTKGLKERLENFALRASLRETTQSSFLPYYGSPGQWKPGLGKLRRLEPMPAAIQVRHPLVSSGCCEAAPSLNFSPRYFPGNFQSNWTRVYCEPLEWVSKTGSLLACLYANLSDPDPS